MMTRPPTLRLVSILSLVVLSLILLGGPSPVAGELHAADAAPALFEPGVVLVAFNPGPDAIALSRSTREEVLRDYGARRVKTIPGIDVDLVSVAEGREFEVACALSLDPRVRYAEPNYLVWAHLTPNDTYYSSQWAHPKINTPTAWDITTGSSTITVAVVDTGVELLDPEFQGRLVTGYDFANNDSDPNDDHGHGTHVAGVVAAAGNNSAGVAGMAWQTRIMPIKVLSYTGNGSHTATALGIRYAVDHGADVINMSLGGPSGSTTLYEAVRYAYDHDVLLVTSAGNCGDSETYSRNGCTYQDQPVYPAAYDTEAFAVAATTSGDTTASFSNRGTYVDIAAPGNSILSTYLGNSFVYMSGTSQAAPHVAGLAALMLAFDPTLTAQELQTHMEVTSVDLGPTGPDIDYGAGRIDALAAVESLLALEAPILLAIGNDNFDGDYWVDWSDTLYATSYTLEEADNPTFISPMVRYTGATSTAFVTGRPRGTWYYRVRGERPSANKVSPWSSTVSTQVGLNTPLLQPIANDGSSSYSVVWQAVTGANAYRLQESQDAAFTTPTTLYEGASLSFAVSGRTGGTWYYRVQAYNSTIDSLWSAIQSTTVLPAAPVLDPIVLTPPDVYTLTWSTPSGATGYRLQEAADAAFTTPITRYLGISATYVVTGQPGGTWYYRVQAYNAAGYGPTSNTRSVIVTVPAIPIPELYPIDTGAGTTSYTVSWSQIVTATDYTLEESRSRYFEAPTVVYTGPSTQTTTLDQPPGPWHYRARAHTPAGSSPWSNIQWVPAYVYLPLVARDAASR